MSEQKEEGPFWVEIRRFGREHRIWFAIGFLLLTVIAYQLPRVVFGAEAKPIPALGDRGTVQPHVCRPSGTPDELCLWSVAVEVQKFKDGFFDRKSGFNPANVFVAPKDAREVVVNHITARLKGQADPPIPAQCAGSERCYAYMLYDKIVNDGSCITKGVPTNDANTCIRTPESSITKQGIIDMISVTLCGGVVAWGFFKKLTSKGLFAMGQSSCAWQLWRDATDDGTKKHR